MFIWKSLLSRATSDLKSRSFMNQLLTEALVDIWIYFSFFLLFHFPNSQIFLPFLQFFFICHILVWLRNFNVKKKKEISKRLKLKTLWEYQIKFLHIYSHLVSWGWYYFRFHNIRLIWFFTRIKKIWNLTIFIVKYL